MKFVTPNEIRSQFSRGMSEMYREEVPDYGTLIDLVEQINTEVLEADPELKARLQATDNFDRISEERHGAIRLGKPEELAMMARVFKVMGMEPVSYYDLSANGVPVHSTAFRPVTKEALSHSPFRVFTSLLRTELIEDEGVRAQAEKILKDRDIFSDELRALVDKAEAEGGLNEDETRRFIHEATNVFRWHAEANVDAELYQKLKDSHTLVADVVSFKGPHINHLTPRVLDIDLLQQRMTGAGLDAKAIVEGPPGSVPILLRQTAFKAKTEAVKFQGVEGAHTARFGEVELRGMALKPQGRELYDRTLAQVGVKPAGDGSNRAEYNAALADAFSAFPSEFKDLYDQGLAYGVYVLSPKALEASAGSMPTDLEALVDQGYIEVAPITYEDFLPASAAGIFQSNLGDDAREDGYKEPSQEEFESHLGRPVLSEFDLYKNQSNKSMEVALSQIAHLNAGRTLDEWAPSK